MAAGLPAAGLVLVHYRVAVFYALGVVAMLLVLALDRHNVGQRRVWRGLGALCVTATVALLLAGPWLVWNVRGGVRELSEATAANGRSGEADDPPPAPGDGAGSAGLRWFEAAPGTLEVPRWLFVQRWNGLLLTAAAAGLALAALRRSTMAWWLIATCALAAVVSAPAIVRLPSSWLVPGFSAAISLWLPAGVGVAFLGDETARLMARRGAERGRLGLALRWCAVVATVVGIAEIADGRLRVVQVVNAATVIEQPADIEAARWIAANTPDSARFLVSAGHWHLGTYRGLDGGYWLPVTAGRSTTMPAGLYAFGDPVEVRSITAFAKAVEAGDAMSDRQLAGLMDESGATYVYVGPAGAGVAGKLTAARLAKVPFLREVYAVNGVHVFARRPR